MNIEHGFETLNNSKDLAERARQVMAGPHSNLRVTNEDDTVFITRGKGARLWDANGKEYIDFMNSAGAAILGHNPEFNQAMGAQLQQVYFGLYGNGRSPLELDVAERLVKYVSCAQKVRFNLSGTEAVQLAIRLARAHTKRHTFIRFEGHYHGWLDNIMGGVPNPDANHKPYPIEDENDLMCTQGRVQGAFNSSFLLPWNDIARLEEVLQKYGDEVAMIIMEAVNCNFGCCPPRPGYLEAVRDLCDKYGIVLCFDEVITAFRTGLGGAQGAYGVTPDLTTIGKAFGGGIPIACVVGKSEIMDQLTSVKVRGAGTFNGYPFGMAAAATTLKMLERNDGEIYNHIDRRQAELTEGLKDIFRRSGLPVLTQGPRGVISLKLTGKTVAYTKQDLADTDPTQQARLVGCLKDEGVLIMPDGRWYICGALSREDVALTLEKAERVVKRL